MQKALRAFKARLETVQVKLRKEGFDYDTVKALAEVAVHRSKEENDDLPLKAVATFSLDEIEADQVEKGPPKDLLDLSSPSDAQATVSGPSVQDTAWDPFGDFVSQNGSAAHGGAPSNQLAQSANPFIAPTAKAPGASLIDFDLAPPVGTLHLPPVGTSLVPSVGSLRSERCCWLLRDGLTGLAGD